MYLMRMEDLIFRPPLVYFRMQTMLVFTSCRILHTHTSIPKSPRVMLLPDRLSRA